jgi:hypothetical protein|tara:strand:+ start:440 stop:691 length:252 start_codon:yes stop_codon:yes gene_type:complete
MDPEIKSKLNSLEYKLIDLEVKLNKITELLEKDISPNCNKMSNHIDFVDKVYDTVKSPLGFICSKVSLLGSNNENKEYNLTDK